MINVKHIFLLALMAMLAACGGGGGSSSGVTTVSGVASKGIIYKEGKVAVYPVSTTGVKGSTPLATGTIESDGAYTVNIGSYTGAIVIEASGKYIDEATGREKTVSASEPLRAALENVAPGFSFTMPVTPLTDLAYRQAKDRMDELRLNGLTVNASNIISEANNNISFIMGIHIINTKPVAPTAEAFNSTNTTKSQKDYALILAAVSQVMANQGMTLAETMAYLNSGLATTETATALNSAMADFISAPPTINKTGVTNIADAPKNIGTIGKKLMLALSGDNVASVQALTVTLTLPDGLLLKIDEEGVPLPAVFEKSVSAVTANGVQHAEHYYPASGSSPAKIVLSLLAPGGLTAGDLITITFDVGGSSPAASDVTLSGIGFWEGLTGGTLTGPLLSLR